MASFKTVILKKLTGVAGVNLLGTAFGFFSQVILTKILGATEYGAYVYPMTWVILISILCRFGYDNFLVKEIPESRTKQTWPYLKSLIKVTRRNAFFFGLIVGCLVTAIIYIFGLSTEEYPFSLWVINLCVILPIFCLINLNQSILIALNKVVISTVPVLIIRHSLLIVLIGIFGYGLNLVFFQNAFGAHVFNATALGIATLVGYFWIRKYVPKEVKEAEDRPIPLKEISIASLPFLIFSGSGVLNQKIDILTLGFFVNAHDIGIYSIASKVLLFIALPCIVGDMVAKPYISAYFAEKKMEAMEKLVFQINCLISFLCFIALSMIYLYGREGLGFFGEEFKSAYTVLIILATGKFLAIIMGPVGFLLLLTNSQKIASTLQITFSVINVILNVTLIPFFGIIGAAIATSIVWISRNLIMLFYVHKNLKINPTILNLPGLVKLVKGGIASLQTK